MTAWYIDPKTGKRVNTAHAYFDEMKSDMIDLFTRPAQRYLLNGEECSREEIAAANGHPQTA